MIVLDTSFLIDFFRGVEKTRGLIDGEVVTTTITYHEIMTGIKKKRALDEARYFTRFFSEVKMVGFDKDAAEFSSDIGAKLLAIGNVVNTLDIMIAGAALAHGINKIITRDMDFQEIAKVSDIEAIMY